MEQINIFHNEFFPKLLDGWRPGEPVHHKYGYQSDRTDLEEIFRDNNTVDGDEINVQHRCRSLSVGDVAQVGDKFYSVEGIGWAEIDFAKLEEWIA